MVFNNNLLLGASGQSTGQANFDPTLIGNSVWLDGAADLFTKSSFAGHASKKVISVWVQRTGFSSFGLIRGTNSTSDRVGFGDNVLDNQVYVVVNGKNLYSNRSFRDIGWYHYLVSFDLTQSLAVNKVKVYINGVDLDGSGGWQVDERSGMSSSFGSFNSASVAQQIGRDGASSMYLKAYLAQYCELDGQSIQSGDVATTDFYDTFTFGTNGSQFIPKKNSDIAALASAAGGNSFCLDFGDSSDLGNDISSNNNDFTPTSMSSANQSVNTPSKVYPIVNVLTKVGSAASTLEEGNTKATVNDNGGIVINPTLPFSGLWYFEINVTTNSIWMPGIGQQSAIGYNSTAAWNNTTAETHVWLSDLSSGFNNNGSLTAYPTANPTTGRFAVAWDGDNRALYFGQISGSTITWTNSGDPTSGSSKTGAAPGNWPTTGTDPLYFIVLGGGTSVMEFDFDEDDWTGSTNRPAAAKALNSANLTAPDFQGIDYFDATLYEGNGQNQRVGDFVPFTDTYTVDKSAMFEEADKRYLSFTPSSGGDQKTFTFSAWFKLTNGASGQRNTFLSSGTTGGKQAQINLMGDTSEKDINVNMYNGSSFLLNLNTDRAFLDESQWNHLVVAIDTRSAVTSANKVKIYINGVQQSTNGTQLSTDDYDSHFNANVEHNIGRQTNNAVGEPSWYLAETVMVEGSQLDPTSFGQVDTSTNRWVPKDVSGLTFGDEGWYLEYEGTFNSGVAATGAGKDSSGNGNHWAEQNDSGSAWATTDQFTDTPSQNFDNLGGRSSGSPTISDGNTLATFAAGGKQIRSNFNLNAGKWYVESDIQATNNSASIGLVPSRSATFTNGPGRDANGGISYETDGDVFSDNVQNATAEASFAAGDVIQMAIDMDAKKVYFGKNNTFGGDPAAGTGGHSLPASILSDGAAVITLGNYSGSQSSTQQINYGQFLNFDGGSTTNGFKYTPPTGFQAVNQDNLDDTASKLTAWAWIKNRDASSDHMLFDRVRGVGKDIHSNSTNAEATNGNTVQRFLQRGVQVGNDSTVNTANNSFVLWQWLLGDSATTGSTNSNGSLNTSVIAADAGHFSVVSWTMSDPAAAKTLGHGLSGAPELIIIKNRTDAGTNWPVFSEAAGNTKYQYLSTTAAAATFNMWQNTSPTSTVFSVSSNNEASGSANDEMIAYCFRSVPGVCKVGEYTANNTTDNGPYVSLGFKPRWILFKGIDVVTTWTIYDSVREPFNVGDHIFSYANLNSADQAFAQNDIDMLSDGFKIKADTNNEPNKFSGNRYLYLAMADIGGNGTLPPVYSR